jgi:hypothetical protein
MGNCLFCDEPMTLADKPGLPIGVMRESGPTVEYAHRECQLREVMGGIGHLIAHSLWCVQRHDPDAGLTFRQSAQLVDAYVRVVGHEGVDGG